METFTDPRDGETYKIVRIGNLLWFAENLRYQGVPHHFPDRNSDNIQKYGCLYTWENAMKACPKEWHLPMRKEFEELLIYADSHKSNNSTKFLSLIANSIAWTKHHNQGVDEFGFSAMPAGHGIFSYHNYFGYSGFWWSSTECDYDSSSNYYLDLGYGDADVHGSCKTIGFSVRCVKD